MPCGSSRAVGQLSTPRMASRAASTPLAAARPTCTDFVIVPNIDFIPAAWLAASPMAWCSCVASAPSAMLQATAEPTAPTVAVVCQPRS